MSVMILRPLSFIHGEEWYHLFRRIEDECEKLGTEREATTVRSLFVVKKSDQGMSLSACIQIY